MSMIFFEGGSYRVSLKTLFCDSWSTLGFGMIQRAGYQSKNIVNILFWLDIPFWNRILWRSSLWLLPAWELQYWSPTLKAAALAVAVLRETHPLLGPPSGYAKMVLKWVNGLKEVQSTENKLLTMFLIDIMPFGATQSLQWSRNHKSKWPIHRDKVESS